MEGNNEKFDYKTLSIKQQYAWKVCRQIMKDLKLGNCTDEQINSIIVHNQAESMGYINPEDYYPAEKAMKFLRVHRNQFFELIKIHKIQCKKINGHPIGYYRGDLERLNKIISDSRK